MNHRPLVSFCVICRNQERYVGEALAGAFAQTYRPLEIVVSDDASSDSTWDVVTRAVERYRESGGDMKVVLNRNMENLGILGNWMKAGSIAHGELLVKADGDDISLPERTARVVEVWVDGGCSALCVGHGAFLMSPGGAPLGAMPRPASARSPLGAAMAFSKRTFTEFGTPRNMRCVDDELFVRRAMMLGGDAVIPDRLVRYRVGTGVSNSRWDVRSSVVRNYTGLVESLGLSADDVEHLGSRMSGAERRLWMDRLSREIDDARDRVELATAPSFRRRLAAARRMRGIRVASVWGWLLLSFLAPRPLGSAMLLGYACVRNALRRMRGALSGEKLLQGGA